MKRRKSYLMSFIFQKIGRFKLPHIRTKKGLPYKIQRKSQLLWMNLIFQLKRNCTEGKNKGNCLDKINKLVAK